MAVGRGGGGGGGEGDKNRKIARSLICANLLDIHAVHHIMEGRGETEA